MGQDRIRALGFLGFGFLHSKPKPKPTISGLGVVLWVASAAALPRPRVLRNTWSFGEIMVQVVKGLWLRVYSPGNLIEVNYNTTRRYHCSVLGCG